MSGSPHSMSLDQQGTLPKRLINLLEQERQEIASYLHNEIGQTLVGAKLQLEKMEAQSGIGDLLPELMSAKQKVIEAISCIGKVLSSLRPGTLEKSGLLPSLSNLIGKMEQMGGFKATLFKCGIPLDIDPEKELAVYRIAQEALLNIVKHAKAKEVYISLMVKEEKIWFTVEDDGVGFDPHAGPDGCGHYGILLMRERAAQQGGSFHLESESGKGTMISVRIPL